MISYYIYLQQCLSFVPSFYLQYVSGIQIHRAAANILLDRLRMGIAKPFRQIVVRLFGYWYNYEV